MQITILALGSTGDILPYAVLGQYLLNSGHDILFVSSENYRSILQDMHMRVLTIPGDAQALVKDNGTNIISLFRSFAELSRQLTTILDPNREELKNTSLIMNQLPIGLYGSDLAEKLDVPMVQAAVMPLTPTRSFPMMGWPALGGRFGYYNRLSYQIFEQLTWLSLHGTINFWRRKTLGLPHRRLDGERHGGQVDRSPMLYGFSQHVLPRPSDWGDEVYIGGYWIAEESGWRPSDHLLAFLDEGQPPVFLGFGSMPVADPIEFTRIIVNAVYAVGQRAIVNTGWAGLGRSELGESILTVDYVPYQWLFPRVSAIVHHGGSGTTGYGLWSGVPSQIVSFLFDQHFWGRRVAEIGAGPAPIPYKRLNLETLTSALDLLANNREYREISAIIGQKIRAEHGLERSRQIIENIAVG